MIAILAILISVFIPSFSRYIDNSRFSNDIVSARSMTTILENHIISEGITELDAFDVRTIIDEYNGGAYDYTPEARNTGFFYIEEINEIRAIRYDESESIIQALTELNDDGPNRLMSDQTLNEGFESSPEEVFGANSHLITTEGSAVAMAVDFVRNMAVHGSAIKATYQSVMEGLSQLSDNAFIRFFSSSVSTEVIDLIETMLTHYHPDTTLYVSDIGWTTGLANAGTELNPISISKIVFTAGLTNVPSFTLEHVQFTGQSMTLPKTVKTISSGALTDQGFPSLTTLYVNNPSGIRAEEGALKSGLIQEELIIINQTDLVDYSVYVTITKVGEEITYDLGNLPIREQVTGYAIDVNGSVITMKIYTNQGLVGYATNLVTVNYYLNQGDSYQYFSTRSASGVFMTPPDPLKTGHTFGGWVYDDATGQQVVITDEDALPTGVVVIDAYAIWN